ncbi:Protein ASI1 [Seiridium cupressi]
MALPGAAGVPAPTAFDNSTMFHNLTQWTLQHFKIPVNVSRYAEDLLLAGPRMLTKLGSIMSYADTVDGFGQRVIPDPTGSDLFLTTAVESTTSNFAADASIAAATAAEIVDQDPSAMASRLSLEGAKGLGSVFSYATSKWALCCVAMAIILNRTHIFAASRRRLRLGWHVRLFLRFLPIVLFLFQAQRLLQSIQCQTSPDFSEMRWGNASKTSDLMFIEPGGYLHTISSTLLMGSSDFDSCRAVNMVPDVDQVYPADLQGSLSLLWPLFGTFCLSHFLETVSCAVQGRPVAVETGMTLFEHSLAFAEADAAVSNQLGWGLFSSGSSSNVTFTQGTTGASIAISRSMIMKRVNTPPEVLLVAFLSAMSHVTSHVLGVFNLQSKFRLLSTGFWAMCFMSSIVYEAFNFSLDDPSNMGLFRFPTVCIIGFIPHVMVFIGIFICALIYGIALTLSALSPPDGLDDAHRFTFRQRLRLAHENMQANISLSDIRVSRDMDFYTALLRIGFGVITMASEAVYLNEDRSVNVKQLTWLEEERFKELEKFRMQWTGSNLGDSRYDQAGTIGLIPVKNSQLGAASGYARERAAQKVPKARAGDKRVKDGVGAIERSSRWILAMDFIVNINRLIVRWVSLMMLRMLAHVGIRRQPRILLWLSSRPQTSKREEREAHTTKSSDSNSRDNQYMLFNDENADMESEMMMRLRHTPETANISWAEIDKRLYQSWKDGGLWGSVDTSGEWEPDSDADDWDTTSQLDSAAGSEVGMNDRDQYPWEDVDDLDDGQRTPTQQTHFTSREQTPADSSIAMSDLARLLNPSTPDERQEAQTLAAHLTSDRIMTRSAYARQQAAKRTRLLTTSVRPNRDRSRRMSPEEEAELLEQLIISRRSAPPSRQSGQYNIDNGGGENSGSWAGLGENGGDNGPQCVVCHSSPRTVIVWPCRCLSLCDECRVTLAMNNFDKCVCCRREVISFSRIYVP